MQSIPTGSFKQYGQIPFYYANGLGLSNNVALPLTRLDISAGSIIDSSGVFQLESDSVITINAAVNGLNGLDTGSFLASKVYSVYLVADPVTLQPTGAILSLAAIPLLPFGYSAYALIGYAVSDSSVHFLKGYWTLNNDNSRLFMFDAPQASPVSAGAAVTATAIALTALVPAVDNLPVWLAIDATPSAASRTVSFTGGNQTGVSAKVTGQVSTVHVTANLLVLSQLVAGVPTVNYLWSAGGGDAVAVNVAGYQFYI